MKRTPLRRKTERESDIQSAICDYLTLRRHFFWRQNTAPTFDKAKGIYRAMPKYAMKGIPDIILIRPEGYFVAIEVKGENGRLSPEQLVFAAHCKRLGAEYYVVKSVDDVQTLGL